MASTRSRSRRIPSGGEPGISVEPEPRSAGPAPIPLRRIIAAGAVGGITLIAVEQAVAPDSDHLGPTQVLITWLQDRFPRGVPFAGLIVVTLHFLICILVVALIAPIIARMIPKQAVVVGAFLGALFYVLHYFAMTPLFPWLVDGRNLLNFVSHVAFGIVVAALLRPPRFA